MSESFDCPHGFGKAASCIQCMADGPVAPPKQKMRATFWLNAARYDGQCGRCGGPIHEGEEIGRTDEFGWCCSTNCVYAEGDQ